MCEKKGVPDLRRKRACLREMKAKRGRQIERSQHKVQKWTEFSQGQVKMRSLIMRSLRLLLSLLTPMWFLVFMLLTIPLLTLGACVFFVVRSVLFLNLWKVIATQVAYGGFSWVRSIGMPASERMIVPGCLAGAPKWIKKTGLGLRVVEANGRACRMAQFDVQCKS